MFYGSETDGVRAHAERLAGGGAALEQMTTRLGSIVDGVAWIGQDAEQFRARADSDAKSPLREAADRLRLLAQELEREADEQDHASAPDGVGGGGQVDGDENKFWIWQDGWAPPWGSTADLQNDIPLDASEFTVDSINQEGKGNCVALSTLAAIAQADPEFLADHVHRVGRERYEVDLFIDGQWTTVEVKGEIDRDGVRGPDGNQNWATLYEQALIQEGVLDEDGTYSSNEQGASVFRAVTGGEFEYGYDGGFRSADMPHYREVVRAAEAGKPVVLCTENSSVSANGVEIVEQHAYTVESVNPDGSLTLVNPWGADSNYDPEDGTHRITVSQEEFDQLFDGVVIADAPEDWER